MASETTLRDLVARLSDTDPGAIGPEFSLQTGSLQSSAGRARLDAAIRRVLGITCPAVYTARTFGQLEAAVTGTAAPKSPAAPTPAVPAAPVPGPFNGQAGVACGIDIEMLANLPEVQDYWGSDFYKTFFSPAEIAYCLAQQEPRMHLAARWCAKEALKKTEPALLKTPMSDLQIVVDAQGQPHLEQRAGEGFVPLPHAVSLTHTSVLAAAVVVRLPASPAPAPVPSNPAPAPQRSFISRLMGH